MELLLRSNGSELDCLLAESEEARSFYARYIHLLCSLRTWVECPPEEAAANAKPEPVLLVEPDRRLSRIMPPVFRKLKPVMWVAIILVVGVTTALAINGLRSHLAGLDVAQNERESLGSQIATPPAVPSTSAASVARLVRTYECVWSEQGEAIADGDRLKLGQCLQLRSGLTELKFDCGARVILQGPAKFRLESRLSAAMSAGKVTVTIEDPAAKGFSIHTPGMEAIDLGTEFGLEVSPNGLEQVHVFRGEVHVAASPTKGSPIAAKRLLANQGIEVNLNTRGVTMVANNGERFIRSVDNAQKYRHVVAYWRFEDHPVGELVAATMNGTAPVRGSLDASPNGNDLYTWSKGTQPRFSGDVPSAVVPRTGEINSASLDNSVPPDSPDSTRDLFTMSRWSQPPGIDLQSITPAAWTVEASINLAKCCDKFQTFVVRDGMNAYDKDSRITPFCFDVMPDKHIRVRFCDVEKACPRRDCFGDYGSREPLVQRCRPPATARTSSCTSTRGMARATFYGPCPVCLRTVRRRWAEGSSRRPHPRI